MSCTCPIHWVVCFGADCPRGRAYAETMRKIHAASRALDGTGSLFGAAYPIHQPEAETQSGERG